MEYGVLRTRSRNVLYEYEYDAIMIQLSCGFPVTWEYLSPRLVLMLFEDECENL